MKYFRQLNKISKINFLIPWIIRVLLIVAILLAFWENNWMAAFVSILAFLLTFLPFLISRQFKIILPIGIQTIIVLFIYASIFLGEVRGYYTHFWWWDSLLHLFSGLALGFVGFLILYIIYKKGKFQADPFLIVFFSFCFALALGTLWEIFEFFMDLSFGLNMQRARNLEEIYGHFDTRLGVRDTMVDLILNAIGAFLASLAGYFYLKKGSFFAVDFWLRKIEENNPKLFEGE